MLGQVTVLPSRGRKQKQGPLPHPGICIEPLFYLFTTERSATMAACESSSQSNDGFRFNSVFKALHKGLDEQRRDGTFCDVILKVNGRKVAAHSCVLAIFSPWMMSTLSRIRPWPFISSDDPEEIDLDLSGSEEMFQALECVVDYLYTGKMRVDHDNVDNLQKVSEVLKVPMITSRCRSWKSRNGHHKQSNRENDCGDPAQLEVNKVKSENMEEGEEPMDESNNSEMPHREDETTSATERVSVTRRSSRRKNTPVRKPIRAPAEDIRSDDSNIDYDNDGGFPPTDIPSSVPRRSNRRKNTPVKSTLVPTEDFMSDGSIADEDYTPLSVPRRSARRKSTYMRSAMKPMHDLTSDGSIAEDDAYSSSKETSPPVPVTPKRKRVGRYSCSKCTFKASTTVELQEHRRSHWGKFYRCNSCSFLAKKAAMLLAHLAESNHGGTVCSLCNFEAPDVEELKAHLKRHEDRKPFWCDTCDMRFKTKTDLSLHMPKHSSETPFVCEVCSKGFKWKGALQSHMVVHAETKQFLCDQCGFRTAHKSYLEAHRLLHTGNTYKCPSPGCTYQAIRKQNLKLHALTHTKEKPYQCEICGQAFSLSKNLRRHSKIHNSDGNQLRCEQCPFTTTRLDKLKEHVRKHHSLEGSGGTVLSRQRGSKLAQRVSGENNLMLLPGSMPMPIEVVMTEMEAISGPPSPKVDIEIEDAVYTIQQ